MATLIAMVLLGYLLGSVSPALLAGRWAGIDLRRHGSESAGATNVVRVLGWRPGLVVLVADIAKGWLAAWLAGAVASGTSPGGGKVAACAGGLAAVLGHVWPLGAGWRGGKGVATAAGALLALSPLAFSVAVLLFAVILGVSRIVSVASVGAALLVPPVLIALGGAGATIPAPLLAFAGCATALTVFMHRTNLTRLRSGTEPQIGNTSRAVRS